MKYICLIALSFLVFSCQEKSKPGAATSADTAEYVPVDSQHSSDVKPLTTERLIVPGKSIGFTKINEPQEQTAKRLGRPNAGDAAMGKSLSTWYADGDSTGYQTNIFFSRNMGNDETARIKQIRVTSPWFRTAEGLQNGSTLAQIRQIYHLDKTAVYRKGNAVYTIYGTDKGIAFEVSPADKCVAIIIHELGTEGGMTYLPMHDSLEYTK